MQRLFLFLTIFGLAACSGGGAVRFAPTPIPPSIAPARYTHPSGAFTVELPQAWSLFERNALTLASAAFSPPGSHTPVMRVAVVELTAPPTTPADITEALDQYQTRIRPDAGRYTEQSREAMGDGSWRLTGARQIAGGGTEQLNTFIQFEDTATAVIEVLLNTGDVDDNQLQVLINTFEFGANSGLEPTELSTLAFANTGGLEPLNVFGWRSPQGAFFISGEVANYGTETVIDVPVTATLYTPDGRAVAEAVDVVMGYGITPGGFAPFSLRFGQGQPALTSRYVLSFGGDDWRPERGVQLLGDDVLTWTDEAEFTEDAQLIITGEVTNDSENTYVYSPRVTVTVFNDNQLVIAAGFADIDETEIEPGEVVPFQVTIPETGGTPSRYILNIQGKP